MCRDHGRAVENQIGVGEARVDELVTSTSNKYLLVKAKEEEHYKPRQKLHGGKAY